MGYLNPIVAKVSPNLFTAAKSAGLDQGQKNQIEQMSWTIDKHRELSKLNPDAARTQYDKLDSTIQDQIKFMFKNADYLKTAPTAGDYIRGALKAPFKIAASPLVWLFKAGGAYNQIINEPYKVAREVAQGSDLFSYKTWKDAWDGKSLYDNKGLKEATDYFGKYDVEVAKGLLAGKTPGEIVEGYGKVDNNILESIKKAYNDPDNFQKVLDGVKYAQISPGRDIARMLDAKPPKSGGLHGDFMAGKHQGISGVLDFTYQIAIDPLTWLTGGTSKFVTKGERIANGITESINSGTSPERAIADAFSKNPKVYTLWENQLGPRLKMFSEAKGDVEKAQAYRNIATNHPGYANPDAIKTLAKAKVFDAASAQKYFESAGNLNLMLAGRVDGMTYMRNGVAIARTNRHLVEGLAKKIDDAVNFNRLEKEISKPVSDIAKSLVDPVDALERIRNGDAGMTAVLAANKEIKGWKRVGQMASRSPAGLEVRTGEDAILTASNFTARARQILPRDMAEALTQNFLTRTADEQFVILRNLDAATMYSMGLGGDVRGEELIQKILREKYGSEAGFATKKESIVNKTDAEYAPANTIKETESGKVVDTEGPIHPYQSTKAVGSLPYDEIGSMIWNIKSKKNIVMAAGGATQGNFSKKLVDAWSILTLFPRLGIRSAIDEAVMYVISAPSKDLRAFASKSGIPIPNKGLRMSNVARTFTGSTASTGPAKQFMQFLFKKAPDVDIFERVGKKLNINPEEALSIVARERIIEDLAKAKGVDVALLKSFEKREAVSKHVADMYSSYLDKDTMDYLLQAFVHSPDALNSMAQSLVAHSALSGKYGQEVMASIVTPSMIDKALESIGVKMSKTMWTLYTSSLSDQQVAVAHLEQFAKKFVGNKAAMGKKIYLDPAEIFFNNHALRPGTNDIELAMNDGMRAVGFRYDPITKEWYPGDLDKVKDYLSLSSHTVMQRQNNATYADVARAQLFRLFNDMKETFHGDVNNYNENLINLVMGNKSELEKWAAGSGREINFSHAVAKIGIDDFVDATNGFRIKGEINTSIDFGNFDAENVIRRLGNGAMEWMDQQVTGIFRQPAVMVTYTQLRKKYSGIERAWAKEHYLKSEGKLDSFGLPTDKFLMSASESLAQKRFTELATREAADVILKYADNPAIRSNFAYSMRTVGRYYRATEDFYRRIYRLKDATPNVIYRMRLAHLGIDASGMIHQDANGEPYVVMPMDNIIFKATDTTLRALTGNLGYTQPLFNEFTFKLRMMNPSFSQDAGLPTLSGPIAGLGVIGVKNFLGTIPGKIPFIGQFLDTPAKQLAEGVDTFALGNIGDNIDAVRATVPAGLQRVWSIMNADEKNRQEVTAAQQAMAYQAAHGISLNPNSTEEEKAAYLKNIRISAHNVIVMRHMLGLFGPVAPVTMETVGVPDYLKDVGIVGLRAEFFDILNSITKNSNGDVQDPYELALATYIGKNPGKLIYTVARDAKASKVLVKNTDGLKSWGIANRDLIKKYGEAAYIFAPQVGNFNAGTYNWIQAAGLIENKDLETYYSDLLVAQDKQHYYDIARKEKELLANTADSMARKTIIDSATQARDALKTSNPLLEPALIGQGNNIGGEKIMMGKVEQIIADPNTSLAPETRSRMAIAIRMMRDYISFCESPSLLNLLNAPALKEERRLQVEANLQKLMMGDLYVTEANRAMFKAILSSYSRDSYYAFKAIRP
jgi:hypothetical protein